MECKIDFKVKSTLYMWMLEKFGITFVSKPLIKLYMDGELNQSFCLIDLIDVDKSNKEKLYIKQPKINQDNFFF